jgi:hypothetical protein
MEVDLQSLYGLHVTWCAQLTSLVETPQLPFPRIRPHNIIYEGAIGQPRHVIPWVLVPGSYWSNIALNQALFSASVICISAWWWPITKYIYTYCRVPQCMSPRRNWDSPPRLPDQRGEGEHSTAGEGVGESQFQRLEKGSLAVSLSTLCGQKHPGISTYLA